MKTSIFNMMINRCERNDLDYFFVGFRDKCILRNALVSVLDFFRQ